jgi:cysteine synthase A
MKMTDKKYNTISKVINDRADIKEFLLSEKPMREIFNLDVPMNKERIAIYKNLYNVIEDTACYNVHLPNDNLLRIKMEYSNSMGNNHYSRYWIPYLFIAEAFGVINPIESEILEITSGSAGISLAMACKELGYRLTMIIPDLLPEARIKPIRDSGAIIIKVNGYIDNCILKLQEMIADKKYFAANHSEESSDFTVHTFSRIAAEYYRKYNIPDYAIIGTGNGTTTEAIFKYFKNKSTTTKLYTYHPNTNGNQIIFGLFGKSPHKFRHVENVASYVDKVFATDDIDLTTVKKYFENDTEISNLGMSSFFGVYLAFLHSQFETQKTFFTIGYDKSDRY